MTAFLEKHPVKNLRTIRKAQNLYEDIEVQGKGIGNVDFWKDIRLVCYGTCKKRSGNDKEICEEICKI